MQLANVDVLPAFAPRTRSLCSAHFNFSCWIFEYYISGLRADEKGRLEEIEPGENRIMPTAPFPLRLPKRSDLEAKTQSTLSHPQPHIYY